MKAEELINTLSNVNVDVNSETALQAVELYVEFLYFEKITNISLGITFLALCAWLMYLLFKNWDKIN